MMTDHDPSRPPVLVIEDCDYDYKLLIRAMHKAGTPVVPILRSVKGQDALEALSFSGVSCDRGAKVKPGLVFLDLNLPDMNGRQILAQIKDDLNLRSVPVIMVSTSDDEVEIAECNALGSTNYIQKSTAFRHFYHHISQFRDYWVSEQGLTVGMTQTRDEGHRK